MLQLFGEICFFFEIFFPLVRHELEEGYCGRMAFCILSCEIYSSLATFCGIPVMCGSVSQNPSSRIMLVLMLG